MGQCNSTFSRVKDRFMPWFRATAVMMLISEERNPPSLCWHLTEEARQEGAGLLCSRLISSEEGDWRRSKACDATVNHLYVNNINNNNDTISHRYYPVIKMGNNRIWLEGLWQETTHWVSLHCTCLIWLGLWMWLWKRVTQTSQECWHPPGLFLTVPSR